MSIILKDGRKNASVPWMSAGSQPVGEGGLRSDGDGFGFSSARPGVVQFCFADGSLHPLSKEIDAQVLKVLSGIHDGESADAKSF